VKNIAFVSIGDESHNCADLLVKSIKKNNSDCQIIQVSTKKDKDVIGVDEKLIFDFKLATFMFNRLESQIVVLEKYGPTLFLDSDMLVNKDLNEVFNLLEKKDLIITERINKFYINNTFFIKEHDISVKYPEFTNKAINEVMPYNGGFIAASNISVLKKLLQIYSELPSKFHFWFGDQVALKKIYDAKEFKISVLGSNYNHNVKDISNYDKNICVYHFKGGFKKLINPFYEKYIR
jgi:hypothetical protein